MEFGMTTKRERQYSCLLGWWEEWGAIWNDKSLLLMLLFLPLLYSVTVYWLYRDESVVDCPVIVVDQDGTTRSSRLTWLMDATEEVRVVERTDSTEEAFTSLRRHQAAAVVLLPSGFENRLLRGEQARMKLWIDSANMLTYGTAYTGIRAAVSEFDNEITQQGFVGMGMPRRQAAGRVSPIEISERLLYHPTGSYGGFMAPAVFVVALQQAILLSYAVSYGNRREARGRGECGEPGGYRRMLGRYLAHLPFHLLSAATIVRMLEALYPFPSQNALGLYVLLGGLVAVTGLLAMVVSIPFTNGRTPMQVLVLVSTPLFLASGYTWPTDQMPKWVEWVARSVPSTPALSGLSLAGMKSSDLGALRGALETLALQGAVYVLLGLVVAAILSRRERRRVLVAASVPSAE
jgi:ABC-2 type transport system permease protein